MKNAWIVACTLLLVSGGAFAQTSTKAPLTSEALAAILGQPVITNSLALKQSEALLFEPRPLMMAACTATETCVSGTVNCSGNSSCTAVDYNCAQSQPGYVICDGAQTSCPAFGGPLCCQCQTSGGCFACCRCNGGSLIQCDQQCS